jgi:hypothetical protein
VNGHYPRLASQLRKFSHIQHQLIGFSLYTWSDYLPSYAEGLGINLIPMLWGESNAQDFANNVKRGYATIALGFNEYAVTLELSFPLLISYPQTKPGRTI